MIEKRTAKSTRNQYLVGKATAKKIQRPPMSHRSSPTYLVYPLIVTSIDLLPNINLPFNKLTKQEIRMRMFLITPKPILLLLLPILIIPRSTADFFPDPGSIPPAFNATPGAWDNFHNFSGCHSGQRVEGLSRLKSYFHYFGYIPAPPSPTGNFSNDFDDSLESAIRLYQRNFRLNVTGELDDPTIRHMVRPRCGVADIINGTNSMANKTTPSFRAVAHYTFFQGQPRWPSYKKTLTYGFLPENQLSDSVKSVFARAFQRWAAVIPLNFSETESYYEADVTIGFYSGDHGDGEAFDGVLGTLAHSFSPTNGRFHLDIDETWVLDDVQNSPVRTAVDLESVAVHEIGHVLGLGHSAVEDAIMYPTIQTRTRKVELADDDVQGIQVLYGSNPTYNASQGQSRDVSGAGHAGGITGMGLLLRWRGCFWALAALVVSCFLII